MNSEPTLDKIEDYDKLKGSKKQVVWAVIIGGILVAVALAAAKVIFSDVEDSIYVEEFTGKIPKR